MDIDEIKAINEKLSQLKDLGNNVGQNHIIDTEMYQLKASLVRLEKQRFRVEKQLRLDDEEIASDLLRLDDISQIMNEGRSELTIRVQLIREIVRDIAAGYQKLKAI